MNLVNENGRFSIVLDTVTSIDDIDTKCKYPQKILSSNILKDNGIINLSPDFCFLQFLTVGKYIQLGGSLEFWFNAHVKRFFGLNLFPKNRELFWVRFRNSSHNLKTLVHYCEMHNLEPIIFKHYPFDSSGVKKAFYYQLSRHVVGKLTVDVLNEDLDD